MNTLDQLIRHLDTAEDNLWDKPLLVKRNQCLTRHGDIDRKAYYIMDGAVRAFVQTETEMTIRFGYRGSFIADLPSFLFGTPSEISIQALKNTTVKSIHKDKLYRFIDSKTEYTKLWQNVLEVLACRQLEREIDILTASPVERYKRVLKRSPEVFQHIPHKYIASYLRMTPETLSRLKKR